MTHSTPDQPIDAEGRVWQDGYDLGLKHGEQMVEKPALWLWVLLGAGIVIGVELIVVLVVLLGGVMFSISS
ncbi:MAG: hypothetical protein U5O16_19800 [Rhodococcus sp. (in: high G+C Gram-positive bacteria)]|uniref:hypothetical protein n=1 Tax=Rhodococcus sp. TaxID=1831 RepID=UPI002AD9CC83|nr:hypothetical protein [Rhodococcus sp. (in: high G+C Gram-positive bacteria)]MDZ7914053.1 hypothetical protein [Rhodococcus sp. (in: high G+C Gram-positive bacteria)]